MKKKRTPSLSAREAETIASKRLLRDAYTLIRSEARKGVHRIEIDIKLPLILREILQDKGYKVDIGYDRRKATTIISWLLESEEAA